MEKILIIDYDQNFSQQLETILVANGYKTYLAEDAKHGIEIAKRYMPDLIICETSLNGISGFDIKLELSKHSNTIIIPFIFISNNPDLEELKKAMLAGADGYIEKTFKEEEIIKTIEFRLRKIKLMKEIFSSLTPTSIQENEDAPMRNDHILVKIGRKLRLISFENIVCVTASKEYSKITCNDGVKVLIRKSMKKWGEILPEINFFRIHRSTIINIEYIDRIIQTNDRSYNLFLKNNEQPHVISQRYAKKLKAFFIK